MPIHWLQVEEKYLRLVSLQEVSAENWLQILSNPISDLIENYRDK